MDELHSITKIKTTLITLITNARQKPNSIPLGLNLGYAASVIVPDHHPLIHFLVAADQYAEIYHAEAVFVLAVMETTKG